MKFLTILFFLLLSKCLADCDCSVDDSSSDRDKHAALVLKIAAIFSILVGGFIGVCMPILSRWVPSLRPDKDIFFVVKAFAAGVILATGFIHILPDAFEKLTSPCLSEKPWGDFPFAGFGAMVAAMGRCWWIVWRRGILTGGIMLLMMDKRGGGMPRSMCTCTRTPGTGTLMGVLAVVTDRSR